MRSIVVAAMALALAACSVGDTESVPATSFTADLNSQKEVPPVTAPAAALTATGTATCAIAVAGTSFTCTVTYAGLSGAPTASHIHSGNANANGTVRVNLCSNVVITGVPACPTTTSGTITSGAQPVSGVTFDALLASMRTYGAYVNVHTAANTGGEIRGQVFGVY